MKEKRDKDKTRSKGKKRNRRRSNSSHSSSESDQWVEKESSNKVNSSERDTWMSEKGLLRTYSKDDIKPKRQEKSNKQIDSYNPSTSTRELNPYWKGGGTGLPMSSERFRQSRAFMKPDDEDNYYTKSSSSRNYQTISKNTVDSTKKQNYDKVEKDTYKSYNWKKQSESNSEPSMSNETLSYQGHTDLNKKEQKQDNKKDSLYMTDEKLNKLAAKLLKAEIMGDSKVVVELKAKLEAAREYRKHNPNPEIEEENSVVLMSTSSSGNSRPLSNSKTGDPRSKGNKRKATTHSSGERTKYFGDDDKYNLAQMFEQEKYGTNYDDEAQLAKITAKHKNPNDDLEDIFMDDISKNKNAAKDKEVEKQRAINQHKKLEKSMEGCEHCVDSKNMLKHLMVSCGNKIYVALPGKQSLVKGQCIITSVQHNTCSTSLDEDVWEEVLMYRKALTQFYSSQNMDVVFFEIATRLHRFPHIVINCIPLPRDVGDMAAIYFKKALLECETEWSMNKKVVDLKGKDVRKCVPKGLPYFWVDFGMDPGFAHVIEDQQLFPRNFGEEIIGGMLDLDHSLWRNPRREFGDIQRKKVLEFLKDWKAFDPKKS